MTLTRGRVIAVTVVLVAIFLFAEAFVAPASAHEVRSPSATAVQADHYTSTHAVFWQPGPPSESLANMSCTWIYAVGGPCTGAYVTSDFPGLHQTDHTLYYVWTGCIDWHGSGPKIDYRGFNIEYFAASRTLVIHCYAPTGWINFPLGIMGIGPVTWVLLAIPTSDFGAGRLLIQEDDRLEHFVGETSTQFDLTTATIS